MPVNIKHASLAVIASILATPAIAQDESVDRDWSGPYIGGSLGYGWQPNHDRDTKESIRFDTDGDRTFNDSVTTTTGADAFSPGFCRGATNQPTPGSCRGDNDGHVGWSAHAGYDYQMGNFLVGGVLEYGRNVVSNKVTAFSTTPAFYSMNRRLNWDGSARLRAGYILPTNTLVYGTGGLAYGRFKNDFFTSNSYNSFTEENRKEDDWGWTLGGGIEQKVSDRFSIGLLYKYTRFTPNDYRVTAGQGTPPSATNPFVITPAGETVFKRTNDKFDIQAVRVTASYRF